MTSDADDSAPGWDAIDAALHAIYGDKEPFHCAATPHYALGGQDPFDGISFYANDDPPHWHCVTYGLTDLYQSDDASAHEESGWGFELTFRLERERSETKPPGWAWNFLQNLARYVLSSRNPFDVNHQMDLRGPIAVGQPTPIVAIAFDLDPRLAPIQTPNGRMKFLQVVGLTAGERHASQAWSSRGILDLIRARDPLLLTRLYRTSFLEEPAFASEVARLTAVEGSSEWGLFVSALDWSVGPTSEVVLGASIVDALLRILPGRLPFDREFTLAGPHKSVVLSPGGQAGLRPEDDQLTVSGAKDIAAEIVRTLQVKRGVYPLASYAGLQIRVVPSEIKRPDGSVAEVIG